MSLSVDSNTFKLISEEWKLRRYSAVQLPCDVISMMRQWSNTGGFKRLRWEMRYIYSNQGKA